MPSLAFLAQLAASTAAVTARRLAHGPSRPTWSWSFEVVADALKKRADDIKRLDAAGQRRAWASMTAPSSALLQVQAKEHTLAGMRAVTMTPRQGEARATVLYLHGGSYVYGSIDTHRDILARIALAASARVVAIDYRLAPEHPFPAQLEDALAAYRALIGEGIEPRRIAIAGDSAGGGLAASLAIALRGAGDPLPGALLLLSPWVDLTAHGGSMQTHARFDYAEEEDFANWTSWFLGGAPATDPRASPTFADLHGLPPTLVVIGGAEMLLDQVDAFVAKLRAAGVEVERHLDADMIHNGLAFAGLFSRCRVVYDVIGRFVRGHLAS